MEAKLAAMELEKAARAEPTAAIIAPMMDAPGPAVAVAMVEPAAAMMEPGAMPEPIPVVAEAEVAAERETATFESVAMALDATEAASPTVADILLADLLVPGREAGGCHDENGRREGTADHAGLPPSNRGGFLEVPDRLRMKKLGRSQQRTPPSSKSSHQGCRGMLRSKSAGFLYWGGSAQVDGQSSDSSAPTPTLTYSVTDASAVTTATETSAEASGLLNRSGGARSEVSLALPTLPERRMLLSQSQGKPDAWGSESFIFEASDEATLLLPSGWDVVSAAPGAGNGRRPQLRGRRRRAAMAPGRSHGECLEERRDLATVTSTATRRAASPKRPSALPFMLREPGRRPPSGLRCVEDVVSQRRGDAATHLVAASPWAHLPPRGGSESALALLAHSLEEEHGL